MCYFIINIEINTTNTNSKFIISYKKLSVDCSEPQIFPHPVQSRVLALILFSPNFTDSVLNLFANVREAGCREANVEIIQIIRYA